MGLDTELEKIPAHLLKENGLSLDNLPMRADWEETINPAIYFFNKAIIDATAEFACAFKTQIAFYSAFGRAGLLALERTINYIHDKYPGIIVILDAKRGDIGNTAKMYAREVFDYFDADACTFNPYMGPDTLEPYFAEPYLGQGKGVIVICMTSNTGAEVFQKLISARIPLYEEVARVLLNKFGGTGNLGLVVGATQPSDLGNVRRLAGLDTPILLPGIGAQKGDLQGCIISNGGGLIVVNSSRAIIYASSGEDFDQAAGEAARKLRDEIREAQRVYNG